MASAFYLKNDAYPDYDWLVYTGANRDAIITFCGAGNVEIKDGGRLFAYGELIEDGDAVKKLTADDTPGEKIPARTINADLARVEAVVWTTSNVDEVAEFIGRGYVEYVGDALYVNKVLTEEDDYVYRNGQGRRRIAGKAGKLAFEAEYTAE